MRSQGLWLPLAREHYAMIASTMGGCSPFNRRSAAVRNRTVAQVGAAGKGGTIKRLMEHLNPRGARVVALESPAKWNAASGTFSATSSTCPRAEKSCCLTAVGTTVPALSG